MPKRVGQRIISDTPRSTAAEAMAAPASMIDCRNLPPLLITFYATSNIAKDNT
jgi:hypothetical protein